LAIIVHVSICRWRPTSRVFGKAIGGCNGARVEIHFNAKILLTERYTPMLWSSVFGDRLVGYAGGTLLEYLEVVDLKVVYGLHAGCLRLNSSVS
jgi:hypothetical protein